MANNPTGTDLIGGSPQDRTVFSSAASSVKGAKESDYSEDELPTEEERKTLRLIADKIPLAAILIAVVEFAERASYYGTSGPFANFIQRPLPKGGNGAGATPKGTQLTPGALGQGLITATALTTLFSFLAYTVPILGGALADTKWGRFRTICYGTAIAFVAHIIIEIAAIPSVIHDGKAIGPFILGLLLLAFGTGFIKSSVGPLMADQAPSKIQKIRVLKSGERVIVDPAVTTSSIMLLYYWMVNVGAFFKLGTTYAEKRIGFWLAFLVPILVFFFMPIFLHLSYKRLIKTPPQGSVVIDTFKVFRTAISQVGVKKAVKGGDAFWDSAKPTQVDAVGLKKHKPQGYIRWDDDFVDEIRRTFSACKLFLFLPIFYLADGGLGAIQNSQAGSMTTNGAPNDLLNSFNPIFIIITAPFLNFILYPGLRKYGIRYGQVARIITGFGFGTLTMIVGAILQWQVYKTSPCGYYSTKCSIGTGVSLIRIWAQLPLYAFPAIGELFVSVTAFEVAYTRAPQRMKGLVYALVLFSSALSSALVLIISPSFKDPNLIWPFVGIGVANFICMPLLWYFFGHLDSADEDAILEIGNTRPFSPTSSLETHVENKGRKEGVEITEKTIHGRSEV